MPDVEFPGDKIVKKIKDAVFPEFEKLKNEIVLNRKDIQNVEKRFDDHKDDLIDIKSSVREMNKRIDDLYRMKSEETKDIAFLEKKIVELEHEIEVLKNKVS